MNDLLEKLGQSWDGFRARQKPLATVVPIPAQHCTPEGATGYVIRRNAMYFSVNINEMKLSRNTQWFTVYDPLVVIVVEFNHGGLPFPRWSDRTCWSNTSLRVNHCSAPC
jgi:hypothetical protein